MYTDILRGIEGVGIFPIVSLLLFVTIFTVVILWAVRADRTALDRNAALPFTEATPSPANHETVPGGRNA